MLRRFNLVKYWNEEFYLKSCNKVCRSKGYVNLEHWDNVTKAKKELIK